LTYCANCGAKLEGNESFCPYCGELFEKRIISNEKSTTSQLETLQHEVNYLKDQLQTQQPQNKPMFLNAKKQESDCWKCCCIIILLMMIFGLVPFTIYF
jgi:uncharacterized membrane protein YvbJ